MKTPPWTSARWSERLRGGISGESAMRAAAARDVEVIPLSRYTGGRTNREGLQLGFAAVDPREIQRGVEGLALALESVTT
jgi:DNA-binding transcriptional MocR family regulator